MKIKITHLFRVIQVDIPSQATSKGGPPQVRKHQQSGSLVNLVEGKNGSHNGAPESSDFVRRSLEVMGLEKKRSPKEIKCQLSSVKTESYGGIRSASLQYTVGSVPNDSV
jgi:hypothetical protein